MKVHQLSMFVATATLQYALTGSSQKELRMGVGADGALTEEVDGAAELAVQGTDSMLHEILGHVQKLQETVDGLEAKLKRYESSSFIARDTGRSTSASVANIESSMGGDPFSAGLRCDKAKLLWDAPSSAQDVDGSTAEMNAVPIRDGATLQNVQRIDASGDPKQLKGTIKTKQPPRTCHGILKLDKCCNNDNCVASGSSLNWKGSLNNYRADGNFDCAQNAICYGSSCGSGIFIELDGTTDIRSAHDHRNGVNGGMCFPGSSTVMTQDGPLTLADVHKLGSVTMDTSSDLRTVQIDRWLWDVHASMGAEQALVEAEFLSITHAVSSRALRITSDHLMFASKKGEQPHMLPARDLSVGDTVFARNSEKNGELTPSTVTSIETVVDYGIYAPFTWSGRLLVDDVLVSNYALFSETFQAAHDQHAWLPWERLMNLFNPFRYFYGLEVDSVATAMKIPAWMDSQGAVSGIVLLVWRLADTFIIYPLDLFAEAVESLKGDNINQRTNEMCERV